MKRLIVVSADETPSFPSLVYGLGIPSEAVVVLKRTNPKDEYAVPITLEGAELLKNLGNGDGVLLMDKDSFEYLRQFYHFGIRNENFMDCSLLKRLSIEGGAFVKCIYNTLITKEILDYFLSEGFCQHRDFSWFKQKVIHYCGEAIKMIDYFDSLPENTYYGFDYEGSGLPLDVWYELSGASICTTQFGGFISFTDCRKTATCQEEYDAVLRRLAEFLEARQDHVWVFNMQYEFQVSHRMLGGITLYDLCDASTINVLDGNHLKKYSLKWTAQYILGATVWDTEFDRISDLVDQMLFEETPGKTKKDRQKVLKVTKENFKNTPEWLILCERYPKYVAEFESLIIEYFGNAFMCIPSEILGYYCNLDAFYTLMLYEERKDMYSEDAFNVFLDNTRLGSLLHSSGLYIDENLRLQYKAESLKMMAWGITYCAAARCAIKMRSHQAKMLKLDSLSPVCRAFVKRQAFFTGDPMEITKYLVSNYLDTLDVTSTGLDEGKLVINFGADFAEKFVEIVEDSMTSTKYKGKLDEGAIRKKKFLSEVAAKLDDYLGLSALNSKNKHKLTDKKGNVTFVNGKLLELEKYVYYENAYQELKKVTDKQMKNVNQIPDKIRFNKVTLDLQEYSDLISDRYFKCKSPVENDEICTEFTKLYKGETLFLASILESTQQLSGAEKFYSNLGIENIEDAYKHFVSSYGIYEQSVAEFNKNITNKNCNIVLNTNGYPEKVFELVNSHNQAVSSNNLPDQIKDVWSNFNGYIAQEQFFKEEANGKESIKFYGEPFKDSDLDESFKFMRKLVVNYLLYKKYAKVLSTYIDGMFKAGNRWVIEGPDHIPLRYATGPEEPGAVEKCFVHYEVNTKSSKRWSSGFHK